MQKVEKIIRNLFMIVIAVYAIFNFIFAFVNEVWCRYMRFFEIGIKISFLVMWVCAGALVTIKIIKKHKLTS